MHLDIIFHLIICNLRKIEADVIFGVASNIYQKSLIGCESSQFRQLSHFPMHYSCQRQGRGNTTRGLSIFILRSVRCIIEGNMPPKVL